MEVAIFSGTRKGAPPYIIYEELENYRHTDTLIVEGGAPGVDTQVRQYAKELGLHQVTCWANWNRYRYGAGPKRNQFMLDLFAPYIVKVHLLPDRDSKGTIDMYERVKGRFNYVFKQVDT